MSKVIDWKKISAHPFCLALPRHSEQEFEDLKNDIKTNGFDPAFPVIVWETEGGEQWVIDGWGRTLACRALGIIPEYQVRKMTDEEALILAGKNVNRRNLTEKQRVKVGLELNKSITSLRLLKGDDIMKGKRSIEAAAEQAGVSARTLSRAKQVMDSETATPELKKAVEAGVIEPAAAVKVSRLPAQKQKEVITKVKSKPAKKGAASKEIKKDKSKLDEWGKEIPKGLKAVFDERDTFDSLYAEFKRAQKRLHDLNKGEVGGWWTHGYAKQLEGITEAIRFNMPAGVCPDCAGEGCKRCKRKGWLIYGNGERPKKSS